MQIQGHFRIFLSTVWNVFCRILVLGGQLAGYGLQGLKLTIRHFLDLQGYRQECILLIFSSSTLLVDCICEGLEPSVGIFQDLWEYGQECLLTGLFVGRALRGWRLKGAQHIIRGPFWIPSHKWECSLQFPGLAGLLGDGTGREAGAEYRTCSESLVKMGVFHVKSLYQQDGFQAAAGWGLEFSHVTLSNQSN